MARQDTTGEFEQFLWHDNQMVGAYTATGATRWEAVWGTGQDVLLGFFDHMAGRNVIPVRDWRNNVVSAYQPGAACTGCTPGASLGRAEYTAEGQVTTYGPNNTITCFEEGSGQVCPMPGNLPFAFNGQWRSPLTGLSYMRNRWYSPRLGQFISHDPLHYVDSTNMYAFAAFDPINSWDPLGLESGGNLAETPKTEEDPTKEKPTSGEEKKKKSKKSKKNNNESDDECRRFDPCSSRFVTEGAGNQQDGSIYNGDQYGFDGIRLMADLMVDSLIMMVAPEEQLFRFAAPLGQAISAKASRVMAGRAGQALAKVCSFTEDTPVLMCDGSLRAIQEVEEGEWVLAQNEETGEVSCRQVVAPYDNPGRSIILVTLEDTDGHTEVIETTDNHPFYVEGRGWTRVDELRPGDMIPSAERGLLMVAGLEWTLPAPYEHSRTTCEFLAWLVYSKFVLLMPLDRIRRHLEMQGVSMAMSTLVTQIERAADLLGVVDGVHWRALLRSQWMAMDATGLKVPIPGLGEKIWLQQGVVLTTFAVTDPTREVAHDRCTLGYDTDNS